ncbi:MAG: hypothetical protein IIY06_07285, partial [Proteobacteria bacterium]|nr:hypothetical protein [Pseudomonadota bacterium]
MFGDRKVTDKTKNDMSLEDSLAVVANETAVSETEIAEINELIASYSHENEVLSEADVSPSHKTLQGLPSLEDEIDEADEELPQLSEVLKHEELDKSAHEKPAIDLNAIWDDLDQITDLEAEEQKVEENTNAPAVVEDSLQDEGGLVQKNRHETVTGLLTTDSEAEHSQEARSKSELTLVPIPKTSEHGGLTIKPPPSKSAGASDAAKQKLSIKPAAVAKKEEDARKAAAEKAAAEKAAAEKAAAEKAAAEKAAAEKAAAEKVAAEKAAAEKAAAEKA